MIKFEDIRVGDKMFMMDRNSPSFGNPESTVVDIVVREQEDGTMEMYGKQGYFTIRFDITPENFDKIASGPRRIIFKTADEAMEQCEIEIENDVAVIRNASKEEIIKNMFNAWVGDHNEPYRMYKMMKRRIFQVTGVDVDGPQ